MKRNKAAVPHRFNTHSRSQFEETIRCVDCMYLVDSSCEMYGQTPTYPELFRNCTYGKPKTEATCRISSTI